MTSREVLVVEDDPVAQLSIWRALLAVDPGLKITCVHSTDSAHQLLADSSRLKGPFYDLVFCDVMFPSGPDGIDLWRYCKERYPWLDFVAISGLAFEEFHKRYRAEGEWPPFLEKPLSVAALKKVFDNLYAPEGFQS